MSTLWGNPSTQSAHRQDQPVGAQLQTGSKMDEPEKNLLTDWKPKPEKNQDMKKRDREREREWKDETFSDDPRNT